MKTPQPAIKIQNLQKTFGEKAILKGINLSLDPGEDLVILGRSGTGKSVTIKCMVGLIKADSGSIEIFGTDITETTKEELNQIRLKMGFMFQNGALYDSMSVRQNLRFALKHHEKGITEPELEKRITEALENVGLLEAIDKMPAELSGGMVKRIGLARTIIVNPEIILYDEPTSGLDTITAREISELIVSVKEKYKATSVVITHDMACARITGQRIIILNEGKIHAEGSYEELEKSQDPWVRSFFN